MSNVEFGPGPSIALPDYIPPANGAAADELVELPVETWREFEAKALDRVPTLVDRLWPEAAFGFVAAPPKKGKTWVALSLALSIATGRPFLGLFKVPAAKPVLYVALEGHRAGLRARVGALSRGLGVDPDSDDLHNLHWSYKPPGLNLADAGWSQLLRQAAARSEAALVIVDVLRAGARLKENDQAEFSALRRNLQPVTDAGHSLSMLHHFGKLSETQKDREPGERMSGTGAMFGALDVAIYITGSDDNAKSLRLEFDARDIAAPEHLSVRLTGEGTGENGGYTYRDYAEWRLTDEVDEDDLKAPAVEIAQYVRDQGGEAPAKEVRAYFAISDHTLTRRLGRLRGLGIDYVARRGKPGRLVARIDDASSELSSEAELFRTSELGTESLNHAGLSSVPNSSEVETVRISKTADLQGEKQFRSSEPLTGESDSASELVELPASNDEPEAFPHAEPELEATP